MKTSYTITGAKLQTNFKVPDLDATPLRGRARPSLPLLAGSLAPLWVARLPVTFLKRTRERHSPKSGDTRASVHQTVVRRRYFGVDTGMLVQRSAVLLAERAKEKRHSHSQEQLMTKKDEGEPYIFLGEQRVFKLSLQQHWEELELTRNRRNKKRAAKSKDIKMDQRYRCCMSRKKDPEIRKTGKMNERNWSLRCGTKLNRCRIKLKKENSSSSDASKRSVTAEMQADVKRSGVAHPVLNGTIFVESWKFKGAVAACVEGTNASNDTRCRQGGCSANMSGAANSVGAGCWSMAGVACAAASIFQTSRYQRNLAGSMI